MCVDHDKSLVIVIPKYLVDVTSLINRCIVNDVVLGDWIMFTSDSHEYGFVYVDWKTCQIKCPIVIILEW